MRKLKLMLMALAIVLGIGGAIASAPAAPPCDRQTQYWDSGVGFFPAGVEGFDYVCVDHWVKVCTYTYNAATGTYTPCKRGEILWLR
jgi:hypothetical protein